MHLIKRKPNLFEEFFNDDFHSFPRKILSTKNHLPSVNIKEDDKTLVIELAAPGLKKDDFSIELNDNYLTILSEKKESSSEENEKYTRKEFNYNSFSRSFNLAEDILNTEKIDASYKDGVLYVTIPKMEQVRQIPKQIKVK